MELQKKYIAKYLFLALSPIFAYNGLNTLCVALFTSESFLEYHHFEFDSLFCIFMLILFSIWLLKIRKHEPDIQTSMQSHMMLKIPVLALGMGGISSLWFILADFFLKPIPLIGNSLQSFDDTWSQVGAESYFWVFLSIVLTGPIVEEVLFRGIVFHYLEKIKSGWFPILTSGIIFGLCHMEPVQIVYTTIGGIISGIVYAKVRNLKITIAIHILNNFLSTLPPFMDTPFMDKFIFYISVLMVIPTFYIVIHMAKSDAVVNPK